MSGISSNLMLIIVGGILFIAMIYIFFTILFSKDKSYPTNKSEKKSIKS